MAQLYIARTDLFAARAEQLRLETQLKREQTDAIGVQLELQKARRTQYALNDLVNQALGMFSAHVASAAEVRDFQDAVRRLKLNYPDRE